MTNDSAGPDIQPMGTDDLLLWQLTEECAEVIQAVCKAQRFGMDEDGNGAYVPNRMRVESEIQDLYALLELLGERGVLGVSRHAEMVEAKKAKVLRFAEVSCREGRIK